MANKKSIDPKIKNAINIYLLKLRRNNFSFDKAILFGSHAKGKAGAESDIDLCIVSSKFGKDMHKETVKLTSFVSDTNFPIDVVSYKPQELNDKYDPLASEIRNFGIEV